jgi:hypothetical protein
VAEHGTAGSFKLVARARSLVENAGVSLDVVVLEPASTDGWLVVAHCARSVVEQGAEAGLRREDALEDDLASLEAVKLAA